MATFIIYKRLNRQEAQDTYNGIKEWFKNNPKRRVCYTEQFKVRRTHIKEDILEHSVTDAFIKE